MFHFSFWFDPREKVLPYWEEFMQTLSKLSVFALGSCELGFTIVFLLCFVADS
jgi:hypothetical protein